MFAIFQSIKSISTDQFTQITDKNIQLLDVRSPQEYRSGHIQQAINVPSQKIDTYRGKKVPHYLICQSGIRSKKAAKYLKKKGYEVINIRGGMNQWTGKKVGGK
ncbi:rhodanese [Enterococcus sp. JM4C]|uniref:rhodanese-like domain-containing protein n=1 Tax=Candidatus Enterococcus huntleyi TaxID=1857217 RepID=UPI00137AD23D|nr:rhodanese-like domain-containing protein [Enterococcus sp. JM4C]KAF1297514.1 rhodanese [Enterococcus sp. JM4C]